MDSFDNYATADITEKWTSTGAGVNDSSVIAAVGRNGTNGWKMAFPTAAGSANSVAKSITKALSPADNTIIVGMAFNPVTLFAVLDSGTNPTAESATSTACILNIRNAGVDQCWFRVNTDGTITAYRGTTILGTTSSSLVQSVHTYIEFYVTVHNTAGVVTVRFNGIPVLGPLTSQNTRNGTLNLWNEIRLGVGATAVNNNAFDWNFDDIYILDGTGSAPWNDFLGDCRVDPRYPTAAGATTGFTPSTGANWENVDEIAPDDDTTYNSAAAVATDTFVVQNAPVAGATIYGIQHNINAKKTDAGTVTIAPVIRHSGVDNIGTNMAPSISYSFLCQIAATNPGTGLQWVEADFNAAEFGYKRTS